MTYRVALALLSLALLGAAACGREPAPQPQPQESAPLSTPTPAQAVQPSAIPQGPGSAEQGTGFVPAVWFAESLRTMVEHNDTIIVGKVLGISSVRHTYEPVVLDQPPAEGTPRTVLSEGMPRTIFSVDVARVIAGPRVVAGQTIN